MLMLSIRYLFALGSQALSFIERKRIHFYRPLKISKAMKTKLHYSSWFLVFTDTKLLPVCRACSTCCKLPHEGVMLWMQDAWKRTMWEVQMRCRWCRLQSFHGLGRCSFFLSIVLALLLGKCSHRLLIQDISVVFTCWILSHCHVLLFSSPKFPPMQCGWVFSCVVLASGVKLP